MTTDWAALAAWRLRDPAFGALQVTGDQVAMDYESRGPAWARLRDAWLYLEGRSILEALGVKDGKLLLRYAALHWKRPPLFVETRASRETAASWIIDLADAYRAIAASELGLFLHPLVRIDLAERVRLAFRGTPQAPEQLPPEMSEKKPAWDERTLVYQVGRAMLQVAKPGRDTEAERLLLRCIEPSPARRWKSLDALVAAAEQLGVDAAVVRAQAERPSFRSFEQGLGWLQLGENQRALACFTPRTPTAMAVDEMLRWGAATAKDRLEAQSSSGRIVVKDPARERHRVTLDTVLGPELANKAPEPVTTEIDWGAPAAWRLRDESFDGMSVLEIPYESPEQLVVTMEYEAPGERWPELRNAWLDIDDRSVLDARHIWKSKLLLEYAALNWKHPILDVAGERAEKVAGTWLVDLADTYRALSKDHARAMHLFWNPVIRIDLDERPRLLFAAEPAPAERLAPELRVRRPRWNERTLVYQVGSLMSGIADDSRSARLRAIVERCLEAKSAKRWSLDELVGAAERELGVSASVVRDPERRRVYRLLERGLSWLEANDSQRALDVFTSYLREPLSLLHREMAEWGIKIAQQRLGIYTRLSPWKKAFEAIEQRNTSPDDVPALVEEASRALRNGDPGHAASLVALVRKHAPDHREGHRILVEVHLANENANAALQIADQLVAGADDALARYLRGKCLLALGRLHEARAAFDAAIQRDPKMLEAMLLRREVDRTMLATRDAVGEQAARTIDIPPALADLRAVLLSGDTKRAIAELAKRADDADAQLVLARFHQFDGDHYKAAHVYDAVASRWTEHRYAALLGKANALLDFGYHQSALAMFDALVAEKPADLDASEGRARVLDKLGRTGEAAAEFRRFVSLATTGSDLRVRVAQAWLDAHPL